MPISPSDPEIPFRDAVRVWARVAGLSFGGPAAQIAVMHRILVEEKGWVGETRFLHALNYCMLLPGPEAHQLAIYLGWLLHRTRGGLVAGSLFVLPGIVTLGTLSWLYARFGDLGIVQALFFGMKAAVLAIVLQALVRISRRALKSPALMFVAALAFIGIFGLGVPFPAIIILSAVIGAMGSRLRPGWFAVSAEERAERTQVPEHVRPSLARFVKVAVLGFGIWLAPLILLRATLGAGNVFTSVTAFNTKMAVVTFGGAYSILAYMAQQAVETYHWLRPDEMLIGLGFAETTPGPLICVVQFVGFMAAFRQPGALDPVLAGTLGGLLAAWATFVPSFVWIFLGGPYIEALRGNRLLTGALSAITAAVVGVILNLALWFALHTLFGRVEALPFLGGAVAVPILGTANIPALLLSAGAILAIFRFRIGMITTLAGCSALGILYHLAFAVG